MPHIWLLIMSHTYKLLIFKIANDIFFLNCIIFQNQCTLILTGYRPARVSVALIKHIYLKLLSMHLEIEQSSVTCTLTQVPKSTSLVFQPFFPYSNISLMAINLTKMLFQITTDILKSLGTSTKTPLVTNTSIFIPWVHDMSWPFLELSYQSTQSSPESFSHWLPLLLSGEAKYHMLIMHPAVSVGFTLWAAVQVCEYQIHVHFRSNPEA